MTTQYTGIPNLRYTGAYPTPSLYIVGSGYGCGATAHFYASPNNVQALSYEWYVNGVAQSNNSLSLSYVVYGGETVYCVANLANGTTIQSNTLYVPLDCIEDVNFGLLYNWYAATDIRKISSSDDWTVPTITECQALADYLGASGNYSTNSVGALLRETGTIYWTAPNTGATNSTLFNGRGGGYRSYNGDFNEISGENPNSGRFFTSTSASSSNARLMILRYDVNSLFCTSSTSTDKKSGLSIRLLKSSTDLSNGEDGIYVGNDGKIYRTICIGTQEWLADNLCETKYRNGDSIPEVTDNSAWAALSTGALCAYDNDWDNV